MEERPVTEAELHAWLDGELHAERRAAVRRHLAEHPDDERRLDSYRSQAALISKAFAQTGQQPILPRAVGQRRFLGAAAAALLLVAGAAAGWFGWENVSGDAADLAGYALSAHRLYVTEARHPVEVTADQSDHLTAWLSKGLDRPLRIPTIAGYQLVGGRLLPSEYGPAAQLMYEDAGRRRVTLYFCAADLPNGTEFHTVRSGPVNALLWHEAGLVWAMVGELDRDGLLTLAHQVQSELSP
jgi:anti-sigma factor RsiW